jgi:hypothetical protein
MKRNPQEQRQDDQRRLAEAFAAAVDRSRLEALLAEPGGLELLGEGAHFIAWKVPARLTKVSTAGGARPAGTGAPSPALSLVVKRAKPSWAGPSDPKRRRWAEAIRALGRSGLPLVPPLAVLEAPRLGALGLAMPFGDQPLSAAAPHWQPVAGVVAELERGLEGLGLALGDVAQGRVWDGIPFLFDFSDLSGC